MGVTVYLHFPLTRLAGGQKKLTLDWSGGTLKELIEVLSSHYGEAFKEELLDERGELGEAYRIFADGEMLTGLDDRVEDRAEVRIIVPIPGG